MLKRILFFATALLLISACGVEIDSNGVPLSGPPTGTASRIDGIWLQTATVTGGKRTNVSEADATIFTILKGSCETIATSGFADTKACVVEGNMLRIPDAGDLGKWKIIGADAGNLQLQMESYSWIYRKISEMEKAAIVAKRKPRG